MGWVGGGEDGGVGGGVLVFEGDGYYVHVRPIRIQS